MAISTEPRETRNGQATAAIIIAAANSFCRAVVPSKLGNTQAGPEIFFSPCCISGRSSWKKNTMTQPMPIHIQRTSAAPCTTSLVPSRLSCMPIRNEAITNSTRVAISALRKLSFIPSQPPDAQGCRLA
ncbi:hypothetical protein D3C72_2026190 [compost metagenome]